MGEEDDEFEEDLEDDCEDDLEDDLDLEDDFIITLYKNNIIYYVFRKDYYLYSDKIYKNNQIFF